MHSCTLNFGYCPSVIKIAPWWMVLQLPPFLSIISAFENVGLSSPYSSAVRNQRFLMAACKSLFPSFQVQSTPSIHRRKLRYTHRLTFSFVFLDRFGASFAAVTLECYRMLLRVHQFSSCSDHRPMARKDLSHRSAHTMDG
jgi:hypothetical protein